MRALLRLFFRHAARVGVPKHFSTKGGCAYESFQARRQPGEQQSISHAGERESTIKCGGPPLWCLIHHVEMGVKRPPPRKKKTEKGFLGTVAAVEKAQNKSKKSRERAENQNNSFFSSFSTPGPRGPGNPFSLLCLSLPLWFSSATRISAAEVLG